MLEIIWYIAIPLFALFGAISVFLEDPNDYFGAFLLGLAGALSGIIWPITVAVAVILIAGKFIAMILERIFR